MTKVGKQAGGDRNRARVGQAGQSVQATEWLITHVAAVGSPARAECEILR